MSDLNLETSRIQTLMTAAYERWQKAEGVSQEAFLEDLCSPPERRAVMIGNLNYQVENGGFAQWVDNGYCLCLRKLARFLTELRDAGCAEAGTLMEDLNRLSKFLDLSKNDRGCFDSYWKKESRSRWGRDEEDSYGDDTPEEAVGLMEKMDTWYYSAGKAPILAAAEAWLLKQ